jgi:hypothetical protein
MGEPVALVVDTSELHLFDPADGSAIATPAAPVASPSA